MIDLLFWGCVLLLAYTYLGYPALTCAWAAIQPRPPQRIGNDPTVSLVIVAHNEASRIQDRIENLLALNYPRHRLEIVLASDGSTDGTPERAVAYQPFGVRIMAFEQRRGKAAVLNEVVPSAGGEIVVLADARQRFEADALRALVGPFADPQVGAVSGELFLADDVDGPPVGEGIQFYWNYEKRIRKYESRVHSTVGATGAIYAIRRELFEPIPEDTLLDDVLVPIRIARRGFRVVFEPGARAYDRAAVTAGQEFTRKVRTIAGNFQLFAREPWLLNPFHNRLWLQTISHKGLRLLSPLLLAATLGTNLLLLDRPFYRWTLGIQVIFYATALGGYVFRGTSRKVPLVSVLYVFCLLNWVTVVAFLRFITGRQGVTWEKASG